MLLYLHESVPFIYDPVYPDNSPAWCVVYQLLLLVMGYHCVCMAARGAVKGGMRVFSILYVQAKYKGVC